MKKLELVKFLEDFSDDYEIFFFKESPEKIHIVATDPKCICDEDGCYKTFIADIDVLEEIPYKEC